MATTDNLKKGISFDNRTEDELREISKKANKNKSCPNAYCIKTALVFYGQNQLVINISSPMKISIAPPNIPALPARLVPAFFPMRIPAKQMKKVTPPISRHARSASMAE